MKDKDYDEKSPEHILKIFKERVEEMGKCLIKNEDLVNINSFNKNSVQSTIIIPPNTCNKNDLIKFIGPKKLVSKFFRIASTGTISSGPRVA